MLYSPTVQVAGNIIMVENGRVYADLVRIQLGYLQRWAVTCSL